MLRRISERAIDAPFRALAVAVLFFGALAVVGIGVNGHLVPSTLIVPGTGAAKATELANGEFGESTTVPILVTGPAVALDRQVPNLVQALRRDPVNRVVSPFDGHGQIASALRPSRNAAIVLVAVDRPVRDTISDGARSVRKIVASSINAPLRARVTGSVAIEHALKRASLDDIAHAEFFVVPIVLLMLLIVFRSPLAALIPTVLAGVTVLASFGVLRLLLNVIDMDVTAISLASMMGMALGVDYSLLVVSRFREELVKRSDEDAEIGVQEAARTTVATAGRTVQFAGFVLAVAMAIGLTVMPGDLLVGAAVGASVTVVLGVIASAIVLPAILVIAGAQLMPRRRQRTAGVTAVALRLQDRSPVLALAVFAAMVALTVPALAINTGPLDVRALPNGNAARSGYQALKRAAGPGWLGPFEIDVVADKGPITTSERLQVLMRWQRRIADYPGVSSVIGPGPLAGYLPKPASPNPSLTQTAQNLLAGRKTLGRLSGDLSDAASAVTTLRRGVRDAASSAHRISDANAAAGSGAKVLRKGLAAARDGTVRLRGGLHGAAAGAARIVASIRRVATGANTLGNKLGEAAKNARAAVSRSADLSAKLREAATRLTELGSPTRQSDHALNAARTGLESMTVGRADSEYKVVYTAVLTALAALDGRDPKTGSKIDPTYDGLASSLESAATQLSNAANKTDGAVNEAKRLADGMRDAQAGASNLAGGARQLALASSELARGLDDAAHKGRDLNSGLGRLAHGAQQLDAGVGRLSDGSKRLASGLRSGASQTAAIVERFSHERKIVGRQRDALPADRESRQLAGLGQRSPGVLRSGYLTLAAVDGAKPADRDDAGFVISLNRGGRAGRLIIIPSSNPNDRPARAVDARLRRDLPAIADEVGGQAALGGWGAVLSDYDSITSSRLPTLVLLLALVTTLILIPIFRSLLLPLVAVSLNLLTVGASFGVLVLLFQGGGPLDTMGFIDALTAAGVFGVLFAVSMDYQVFVILRMRERWLVTGDVTLSIRQGLEHTAKVVTGAAAIMLAVFVTFGTGNLTTFRQFGIGLSVAVALDATLVRLVLLPAAMRLLGPKCWWLPDWMDRALPALRVEDDSTSA